MKKTSCILLLALLLGSSIQISAQTQVFGRDQSTLAWEKKKLDSKYFQEGYLAYGFILPVNESDSAQSSFPSALFAYGTRGSYKFNATFAGVWGLEFNRKTYSIRQDSLLNQFSPGQVHTKERFTWNNFRLSAGLRIQLGKTGYKRGDFIMFLADLEYGAWVNKLIEREDPAAQSMGSGVQEYRFKKLGYVERFQSNLSCRIGRNSFALFARYRMTALWRADENVNGGRAYDELGRWLIGVDLSF